MIPHSITTVISAASTYDLTTLAVVKNDLGITGTGSDIALKRYLTSASAAAAQFCNRVFPPETIQDEFWPQRDRWPRLLRSDLNALQLSRWPLVSVTSVTENAVALVDGTDFRIDYANGQLIRLDINGYPRSWPFYAIVVVYVGGFAAIPADVEDAVLRMVKGRYLAKNRDPALRQENTEGIYSAQYWFGAGPGSSGHLPPDIEGLLEQYRTPVMG